MFTTASLIREGGRPDKAPFAGVDFAERYGQLFEPPTVLGVWSPSVNGVTFVHLILPFTVFPATSTRVESAMLIDPPTTLASISTKFEFLTVIERLFEVFSRALDLLKQIIEFKRLLPVKDTTGRTGGVEH